MISAPINGLRVSVYRVPTDAPEPDGALEWDATTLVLVKARAGETRGIGFTDADTATAKLIEDSVSGVVRGLDALDIPQAWNAMTSAIRNLGPREIAAMAMSAVDNALSQAAHLPLSAPCGPAVHAPVGCAARTLRRAEYSPDYVHRENLLFDGAIPPAHGALSPDLSRLGHGLECKHADAARFQV